MSRNSLTISFRTPRASTMSHRCFTSALLVTSLVLNFVLVFGQEDSVPGELSSSDELFALDGWGTSDYPALSYTDDSVNSGARSMHQESISIFGQSTESEPFTDYLPPDAQPTTPSEAEVQPGEDSYDDGDEFDTDQTGRPATDDSDISTEDPFTVSGSSFNPDAVSNSELKDIYREFWNQNRDGDENSFGVFGASLLTGSDGHHVTLEDIAKREEPGANSGSNLADRSTDEAHHEQRTAGTNDYPRTATKEEIISRELWEEQVKGLRKDFTLHGQSVVEIRPGSAAADTSKEDEDGASDMKYDPQSSQHHLTKDSKFSDVEWDEDEQAEIEHLIKELTSKEKLESKEDGESREVDGEEELSVTGQSVLTRDNLQLPDYVVELSDYEDDFGKPGARWMDEEQVVTGQSVFEQDAHGEDSNMGKDTFDDDEEQEEFLVDEASTHLVVDGMSDLLEDSIDALDM